MILRYAAALFAAVAVVGTAPALAGPYYEGKEVTLIVPNTPAGTMSQYAHTLAPHIAENLGADNVRVENQPGAGSLVGTNNVWNSDPDGLTFGFTNVPTLLVAQIAESPGAQFDATNFTYLGRAAADPRVLLAGKESGIQSVEDIRDLGRPFVYASQGTDEDFYTMMVLGDVLGFDIKVITGYEGAADTQLAVIKGDADGQITGWAPSLPVIESGDVVPVVFISTEKQDVAPEVPTVFEFLEDETKRAQLTAVANILTLSRGFFGPADMDPQATEELRAAIEATLTDPAVIQEMQEKGLPIVFMSGEEQQKLVQEVFSAASDLTPLFQGAVKKIQ